ncbi:MAG: hypothetical protein ACOC7U_00075 [Spirochaetota bacterium]
MEGFGNFTYSAIAIALTGFGAAGTLVFVFRNRIKNREYSFSYWCVVLFIFFTGLGFFLSGHISFDPLRIIWDPGQLGRLAVRYFIYTVPFVLGAFFIVIAFSLGKPGRVYFYNLLGSGCGIFVLVGALYLIPPGRILIVPLALAGITAVLLIFYLKPCFWRMVFTGFLAAAGLLFFFMGDISVLPYKGIKQALNLPDAGIIHQSHSPFGTIQVVKSRRIRFAPGLSLKFKGSLPSQMGLFIDGDKLGAIDRIKQPGPMDYLAYQTQSAVYTLYEEPSAFIMGLGGGSSVERAFRNGAEKITATEENPHLPTLLNQVFSNYTGSFFTRENITIVNANGRNYLKKNLQKWDIIDISEVDRAVSSIGGIYSTNTNYTCTAEAFAEYLKSTTGQGAVSITLLLKNPPRDLLKLTSTMKKAMNKMGIDPAHCITVIRSWATGTLIAKQRPFSAEELDNIKQFCTTRAFDLVYYPGVKKTEVNRFNIVPDAMYHTGVSSILQGGESFINNYLFNIRPSTDNRPYFSFFFRIKKVLPLLRELGKKWLPVVEGGYLILFSTFITTMVFSFILIVTPIYFMKKTSTRRLRVLLYFGLIAVCYMFIEILLMEKHNKYLANPIYSNSVTLASILIFSGAGSYFSDYFINNRRRVVFTAVGTLSAYLVGYLFFSDFLYAGIVGAPVICKLAFSICVIAPVGFMMGFPFPTAISSLKQTDAPSVPWAWSVNGYFSVIASSGVVILSSNAGLFLTGVAAVGGYIIAAAVFPE